MWTWFPMTTVRQVQHTYIAEKGFSLVELVITLGLAALLMSLALPNFQSAINNSRMTGHYNSLTSALTFARSEAIKRASSVSVCARETDDVCGTNWNNGWLVFDDAFATPGLIDAGETVLKRVVLDDEPLTIDNSARITTGAASPVARPFIRFGPRGTSNWRGAGYFVFCDVRGTESVRVANISLAGDVRRGRRDGNNDVINAFGGATTCP